MNRPPRYVQPTSDPAQRVRSRAAIGVLVALALATLAFEAKGFEPAPPDIEQILYWASDGHVASRVHGPRDVRVFDAVVDHVLEHRDRRPRVGVKLVWGGDMLELLEPVTASGVYTYALREPEAAGLLRGVADARPGFFESNRRLLAAGVPLDVIAGNHDAALALPEVQATLHEILGSPADGLLQVVQTPAVVGDALIVHGHESDRINRRGKHPLSLVDPRTGRMRPSAGDILARTLRDPTRAGLLAGGVLGCSAAAVANVFPFLRALGEHAGQTDQAVDDALAEGHERVLAQLARAHREPVNRARRRLALQELDEAEIASPLRDLYAVPALIENPITTRGLTSLLGSFVKRGAFEYVLAATDGMDRSLLYPLMARFGLNVLLAGHLHRATCQVHDRLVDVNSGSLLEKDGATFAELHLARDPFGLFVKEAHVKRVDEAGRVAPLVSARRAGPREGWQHTTHQPVEARRASVWLNREHAKRAFASGSPAAAR